MLDPDRRALCLFVPGLMGSGFVRPSLARGDKTVWFSYFALVDGEMENLELDANGQSVTNPFLGKPHLGSWVVDFYQPLLRQMSSYFNIRSFTYYWRYGVQPVGDEFVSYLERFLPHYDRVYILAHSYGGLVTRYALNVLGRTALTDKIVRVVSLGSPLAGSFESLRGLAGLSWVSKYVASIMDNAVTRGATRITLNYFKKVAAHFPSVYHCLPYNSPLVYPQDSNIAEYYTAPFYSDFNPQVVPGMFQQARDYQASNPPIWDPPKWICFAGVNRPTVVGLKAETDPTQDSSYIYSQQGDGTVPMASALAANVQGYQFVGDHWDICSTPYILSRAGHALFFGDILRHGASNY